MLIPITAEDFIAIGERFLSEDLIAEVDRLLPLATADIAQLATRGYGQSELTKLAGLRASLVAEVAGRNQQRGSKKGGRLIEGQSIREGKLVLRSGEAAAIATLTHRAPAPGETTSQTRQIVTDTLAQISSLGGTIGQESAMLRTRLTSLVSILALPALAVAPEDAPARAALVEKVKAAIAALPELAEQKKTLQQDAKARTSALDELDGRTYTNLKTMTKVGRACWNEQGNRQRAGEYQLNALNDRGRKGAGAGESTPQ